MSLSHTSKQSSRSRSLIGLAALLAGSLSIIGTLVFPIKTEADVSAYENGMPVRQFEAKVKSAIAKNIDID